MLIDNKHFSRIKVTLFHTSSQDRTFFQHGTQLQLPVMYGWLLIVVSSRTGVKQEAF